MANILTPEQAAMELLDRREARKSINVFAKRMMGLEPARHHKLMNAALERVYRREILRLMIFMPPGHAKSTYGSVLGPGFYMGNHPKDRIIAGSHTADLAASFGRQVRNFFDKPEWPWKDVGLATSAEDEWETTEGGGYLAAGVGGAIAGRRADGVVIDDPIKSRKDADSKGKRDQAWDWYKADVRTRLKPNAWIALIQTRWHIDDLAGRLLPRDYDNRTGWVTSTEGERWYVINMPAIAPTIPVDEDGEPLYRDPLKRQPGDALWPEYITIKQLLTEKRAQESGSDRGGGEVGSRRNWQALYQQKPMADEGGILKRSYFRLWEDNQIPKCDIKLMGVDTAYSEKTQSDFSAITVWGRFYDDKHRSHIILLYAWRGQVEFPELCDKIEAVARKKVTRPQRILIENKAAGLSVIQELRRRIDWPIVAWDPTRHGDKVARAYTAQSYLEGGAIWVPKRKFAEMLVDECAAFPQGPKDDLVDTFTMAMIHFRDARILVRDDEEDIELIQRHTPKTVRPSPAAL